MDLTLNQEFDFEGWKIRYAVKISAPSQPLSGSWQETPIVFIHGAPWSSLVFLPIIEALLARNSGTILYYDLAGYGESQHRQGPDTPLADEDFDKDTSVDFQAKLLQALLKRNRMDVAGRAPAVIAHDIGASIALRAHLLLHCNFASLMLINPLSTVSQMYSFHRLEREKRCDLLKLRPSDFEGLVRDIIRSACHNLDAIEGRWEDALAHPWIKDLQRDAAGAGLSTSQSSEKGKKPARKGREGPPAHHTPTIRQQNFLRHTACVDDQLLSEMRGEGMLESVNVDVKLLWGKEDQWNPDRNYTDVVMRMKGRRLIEHSMVENAGNLVMIDQPERVAIEILGWLSRPVFQLNLATRPGRHDRLDNRHDRLDNRRDMPPEERQLSNYSRPSRV